MLVNGYGVIFMLPHCTDLLTSGNGIVKTKFNAPMIKTNLKEKIKQNLKYKF